MKNKLNKEFDFSALSVSKLPLFVLLTITAVLLAISCLGSFTVPDSQNNILYLIKNSNETYIFSNNEADHYVTLLMGFVIGFYQFMFLHNKNYARAILVKGEKRAKIFKDKVFLPIALLTLIILLVKGVVLLEYITLEKIGAGFLPFFTANTLIIIVHAIFGFTIGATASVLSGTKAEAILGGITLLALPKIILKIIDVSASRFLHGYSSFYRSKSEAITFIDPIRQTFETTNSYSQVNKEFSLLPVNSIIHSVFWIIAIIVILIFLKSFFCKNYKFENIGFTNSNKLLTSVICFSTSVYLSYYIVSITTYTIYSYYEIANPFSFSGLQYSFEWFQMQISDSYFYAFLILSLVLSIIVNLAITRKLKNIKAQLPALIMIVSVFLLSTVICATGCFGYTKRMPDPEAVLSVEVNTPFSVTPTTNEVLGYQHYSEVQLNCVEPALVLTEKEDVELLQKLQTTAIKEKSNETNDGIKITYHLKNGKTLSRNYFYLSSRTSEEILSLWDTKAVKSNYKALLLCEVDGTNASQVYYSNQHELFFDSDAFCYLTAKDGVRTNITEKLNGNELQKTLLNDINSMTSAQWFKPETTYGLLQFNDIELNEDTTPGITTHHQFFIPVTSEMKNTVEYLKKNNLFDYLKTTETNFVAYLYDVNASDYWLTRYQDFGVAEVEKSKLVLSQRMPFDISYPLSHSTLFTTEYNRYDNISGDELPEGIPLEKNLNEVAELGYSTKLSPELAKEYFEKGHIKYYSGVGGTLLLIYYPERQTTQTFILP